MPPTPSTRSTRYLPARTSPTRTGEDASIAQVYTAWRTARWTSLQRGHAVEGVQLLQRLANALLAVLGGRGGDLEALADEAGGDVVHAGGVVDAVGDEQRAAVGEDAVDRAVAGDDELPVAPLRGGAPLRPEDRLAQDRVVDRRRVAEHGVERRRDVGGEDRALDVGLPARRQRRRQVHDERDAHDLGRDDVGVAPAPLLAERIAVVGGEDDDAVVQHLALVEEIDEAAEAGVDVRDARGVRRV